MLSLVNSEDRRIRYVLAAGAWLLLAGCLAFNIYLVLATPYPGVTFDARWEITNIDPCNGEPETCPDLTALRRHDRLISVGGIRFEDFVNDPTLVPFDGYLPGEMVPLVVQRDGRTFEVEWRMQPVLAETIVRFAVISLLVFGSFWLAGTFVLLYMRPADQTWVLLVSLFYLTTIWLAVGLVSLSNVAYSALILRVVGWIIAPVMVHLHLVVPKSRLAPRIRPAVMALYMVALLLLLLQLAGQLPWFAYLGAILLAAIISIGLLTYRVLTPRASTEKSTARLMLAGIVLALVPGLVLSAIPLMFDVGGSDAMGAAFSILALPMLPLFYIYAVYKYRLGELERRVNRFLVQYALVLLYFIVLALVFVITSNWILTADTLLSIIVLVFLAAAVALLPIRRPVQAVFDRLTYGTRYSHRQILADFADRIPAAVDRQELVRLLKYELAPEMEIRQSALYVRNNDLVAPLYTQGVGRDEGLSSWTETVAIIDRSGSLLGTGDRSVYELLDWVRLVVPLRVKGQPSGVWLFGRRETEDIYSQDDIDLLDRLSNLVAVTLESSQLLDVLSDELDIRRRTELRLAEQSERLRLLHEIDRAVLAASSPAEIARAAFASISQLVPCVRVSVFLFDERRQSLTILAAQGKGTSVLADNDSFPLDALPFTKRILQGRSYVNDNLERDFPGSKLVQTLVPAGIRSVISVPLIATGSVFGALSVGNDIPASYSSDHVTVVEEVANSVALAIHNARLRDELDKNSRELQLLSARLIRAQELERKRLSHELHDEMGQLLTAISLNLAAIERNLPSKGDESLREQLANANEFVMGLTNQVRTLSLDLRPSMLHDLGLISTLRWYVSHYAQRNEAKINFAPGDLPEELPESIEITVYRIIQEALTNVSRHAGATEVDLGIHSLNGCLQIVVVDNGCGFDVESEPSGQTIDSGIGLIMMRERVSAVNGRLEVRSAPGRGTQISAEIPVEEIK